MNSMKLGDYLILFFSFLIILVYCVTAINSYQIGAFPDEGSHTSYILDGLFPNYATGTNLNGTSTNHLPHPFLYYTFSNIFLRLFGLETRDSFIVLRYINVVFTCLTVLVLFATSKTLALSRYAIAFAIFSMLSVPMFFMLGASVNNDPLGFLACGLFLYGLVRFHLGFRFSIELMVLAGVVAAFTKATAALTVVCLAASYAAFNGRLVVQRIAGLNRREIAAIIIGCVAVLGYYTFMIVEYGHPFPSPGPNPAEGYAIKNPDAQRRTLTEQISAFVWGNLKTLTITYGHVGFPDVAARRTGIKILLALIAAIVVAYTAIANFRKYAHRSLFNSIVAAFVVFIGIYFYEIYSLHLKTGYPGATQARYFFGFLPALALVAAAGLDRIGFGFARLPFAVFAIFCTLGLYAAAGGKPAGEIRITYNANEGSGGLGMAVSTTPVGAVNSVRVDGDVVTITGWAVDPRDKLAPPLVVAFRGDNMIGISTPSILRRDLAARGTTRSIEPAGFRMMLRIRDWEAAQACELRFFAIQKTGSAAPLETKGICKE